MKPFQVTYRGVTGVFQHWPSGYHDVDFNVADWRSESFSIYRLDDPSCNCIVRDNPEILWDKFCDMVDDEICSQPFTDEELKVLEDFDPKE